MIRARLMEGASGVPRIRCAEPNMAVLAWVNQGVRGQETRRGQSVLSVAKSAKKRPSYSMSEPWSAPSTASDHHAAATAERVVTSLLVVLPSPRLDPRPSVPETERSVLVEAFVSQPRSCDRPVSLRRLRRSLMMADEFLRETLFGSPLCPTNRGRSTPQIGGFDVPRLDAPLLCVVGIAQPPAVGQRVDRGRLGGFPRLSFYRLEGSDADPPSLIGVERRELFRVQPPGADRAGSWGMEEK